ATVGPRLDEIAGTIHTRFESEPLLEAGLHATIGDMYRQMANFGDARVHMEAALRIRREALGASNVETLRSMKELAELYRELGEIEAVRETQASKALLEEALNVSRGMHGDDDEMTLTLMTNLARVYYDLGRETSDDQDFGRSRELYLGAQEHLRRLGLGDSLDALRCETGLGMLAHERAKRLRRSKLEDERAEAEAADAQARGMLEDALARQVSLVGKRDLLTQKTMNNLAVAYSVAYGVSQDPSYLARAERLFSDLLSAREKTLGRMHKRTLTVQANLGELYLDMGAPENAIGQLRGALEGMRTVYAADNLNLPYVQMKLAEAFMMAGRLEESEGAYAEAVRMMRAHVEGPESDLAGWLGEFLKGYGRVLVERGRREEARAVLQEAVQMLGGEGASVREVEEMLSGLEEAD
ncbi:MAG: tetratricopeptide repeat protein, partial [Phycisphaerales bacterium]|nr:tetratricopeptide repeat protein [Phycisphaerales bacterium]